MRNICSLENPYTEERDKESKNYGWIHEGAISDRDTCDCCSAYKCTYCGLRWKVELPQ